MSVLSATSRTIRYLQGIACFPKERQLGFLEMGLGIEKRHEDFGAHWKTHLRQCKAAQERFVAALDGASDRKVLAILGAGRLLDVDLPLLSENFDVVSLVDADPLCKRYWREIHTAKIHKHLCEVSGVLTSWQRTLKKLPSLEFEATLEQIRSICPATLDKMPNSSFANEQPHSAIVSLNLLSQIPIVWQNVVESSLRKRFGAELVSKRETDWIDAFRPSAEMLIRQHIRDLNNSGAKHLLLVCDLEYARYQAARDYSKSSHSAAPMAWQAETESWVPNSTMSATGTLNCELQSSLYGVDLADCGKRKVMFSEYDEVSNNEWTWHIQPQGYERRTSGMIHRVAAYQMKRKA